MGRNNERRRKTLRERDGETETERRVKQPFTI